MLTTQSENFQNFEFESLAGISSNTWQAKIQRNRVYCEDHCSRSSRPCSHARGRLRGRPQLPLPRPEPGEMEGRRGTRPGPPSLSLLFLHDADRHDRARADPQHTAAETKPLQHVSKVAVSGVARRTSPGPPHRRVTGCPRPRRSGL
jgi:hypothetical protein